MLFGFTLETLSPEFMAAMQLFRQKRRPPDVEFGCFAAFLMPSTDDEDLAVLKIGLGAAKGRNSKLTDIVMLLSKDDLFR